MAPKIKLVYFNMEGRAELTRLILAQAGVEFEDKRVTREEWMAMKPGKLRSKSQG
jgi:glutathione S-transferase